MLSADVLYLPGRWPSQWELRAEGGLCCRLQQCGVAFPSRWADFGSREGGICLKYHRLSLILLTFSEQPRINVSSFAEYPLDHFRRFKQLKIIIFTNFAIGWVQRGPHCHAAIDSFLITSSQWDCGQWKPRKRNFRCPHNNSFYRYWLRNIDIDLWKWLRTKNGLSWP